MPTISVVDTKGNELSKMELSDSIFGVTPNKSVLHQAIVNYLANQRQGTQSTKTRTEVRGGGKKPWRQKGTGRARHGSIRSPIWVGGGVALGPKPRDYSYSLNKKVKKIAMLSALSAKVLDDQMVIVDKLDFDGYKTKEMVEILENLGKSRKPLIVLTHNDDKVVKSARNIKGVKTTSVNTLNVYDILNSDKFIIVKEAVEKLEEVYAK